MNNYEFLKKIDAKLYLQFIKRGIIPIHIMDYLTIYECFLYELQSNKKSIAITFCSEKYNCSENTIRNIIKFMNL